MNDAVPSERTVFITGGTDGLGRAVALNLAAEGVRLVVHGRDRGRLERLSSELAGAGGQRRSRCAQTWPHWPKCVS